MEPGIHMYIEVAGCPTVCEHCWAQGVVYGSLRNRWLDRAGGWC